MSTTKGFEQWVLKNYQGKWMGGFPADWNQEKEFFYKINELQHRIRFQDVPLSFRKLLGIPKSLPAANRYQ
jgi:hypothetical protein